MESIYCPDRRQFVRTLSALAFGSAAASSHAASPNQAATPWRPTRPVTLVVPFGAGGGADYVARAISKPLATMWGQSVIVENVPGADGLLGTKRAMDATPDGHTLLIHLTSLLLMKHLPSLKGIDPLARLEPISQLAISHPVLVVGPSLPVNTFKELVAYCKRSDARCSAGFNENLSKLGVKKFVNDFGFKDLVAASYRNTTTLVTDISAGEVTFAFTGATAALPLYKAGKLKILAASGSKRSKVLPDIPSSDEAGWSTVDSVDPWYALFAPKGTAPAVTDAVSQSVMQLAGDTDIQRALDFVGAEPVFSSPGQFATRIKTDSTRLADMARRFPFE